MQKSSEKAIVNLRKNRYNENADNFIIVEART